MKSRIVPESNYRSIWLPSGKTIRIAIDPSKPITELEYPEFYDVSLNGSSCFGGCRFCYMNETPKVKGEYNNVEKLKKFFNSIPKEHLPYQIAYGPEIAHHPEFHDVMKMSREEYDILGNFTTNGTWVSFFTSEQIDEHLDTVKRYCGGVAISANKHLEDDWTKAAELYIEKGIITNFHVIISDKESIDYFIELYEKWKDKIEYFVLLPYKNVGRAKEDPKELDWEYFKEKFPKENTDKIAFGALFYPYLLKSELDIKISLYEPEILSKYVDLKNDMMYPSSFTTDKPLRNIFKKLKKIF
jgi:MoaA/NifB/PqqE/SkfB family radical SAM enzyme